MGAPLFVSPSPAHCTLLLLLLVQFEPLVSGSQDEPSTIEQQSRQSDKPEIDATGAVQQQNQFVASIDLLYICLGISLILVSIVGNCLVCVAIFTDRRLRKLGNAFIVSLAIADLFVSCLVMTFALCNDLMERWIFGHWFCDVWISFDIMCCTASILNLCAISLDRFIHIKDCLLYSQWMTRRAAVTMLIMIWFISALVSFVPITLGWHKPDHNFGLMPSGSSSHRRPEAEVAVAATRISDESRVMDAAAVALGPIESRSSGGRLLGRQVADYINERQQSRARRTSVQWPVDSQSEAEAEDSGLNISGARNPKSNSPREGDFVSSSSEQIVRFERRAGASIAGSSSATAQLNYPLAKETKSPPNCSSRSSQQEVPFGHEASGEIQFNQVESNPQDGSSTRAFLLSPSPLQPPIDASTNSNCNGHSSSTETRLNSTTTALYSSRMHHGSRRHLSRLRRSNRRRRHHQSPSSHRFAAADVAPVPEVGELHRTRRLMEPEQSGQTAANISTQQPQCMLTLTPTYAIISSTISFYIPCLIMLGLYTKLFACARRHVKNIQAISKAPAPISAPVVAAAGSGGDKADCDLEVSGKCINNRRQQTTIISESAKSSSALGAPLRILIKFGSIKSLSGSPQRNSSFSTSTTCNSTNAQVIHSPQPNANANDKQTTKINSNNNNGTTNNKAQPEEMDEEERRPFFAETSSARPDRTSSQWNNGDRKQQHGGTCSAAAASAGKDQQVRVRLAVTPSVSSRQQQQQQSGQQLATHKAAVTLGIIMGTFLFCWVPFFCLNIIKAFCVDCIPSSVFRAFTWLGYANSALNPIIYGIHNSEFRNAFNRIFFKHLNIKNSRYYMNRRFSYDLRHNQNNHHRNHRSHHHHNHNNLNHQPHDTTQQPPPQESGAVGARANIQNDNCLANDDCQASTNRQQQLQQSQVKEACGSSDKPLMAASVYSN